MKWNTTECRNAAEARALLETLDPRQLHLAKVAPKEDTGFVGFTVFYPTLDTIYLERDLVDALKEYHETFGHTTHNEKACICAKVSLT